MSIASNARKLGWVILSVVAVGMALFACASTAPAPTKQDGSTTGGDTDPGASLNAHDYYMQEVDPGFARDCKSCHATGQNGAPVFMDTNAEASYQLLKDSDHPYVTGPEDSELLLHGPHTGPGLTDAEIKVVTKWLTKEQGDAATGGPTLKQALAEFGECMEYDDFVASGMYELGQNKAQSTAGPCAGCHSTGQGGAWISATKQEMFTRNQQLPWVKRLVTGTVDKDKHFSDLIPSNRYLDKGDPVKEPCTDQTNGAICHPQSALPDDLKTAIQGFVDLTLARWRAKQCKGSQPDGGTDGG